jgi:hypothetical protein
MRSEADDQQIRTDAVRLGRYLTGEPPSQAEIERYVAAIRSGRFVLASRDQRTLDFVRRHPRMLGIVDGGLALRRPRSGVRQRILVMASILEATTEHADQFLPRGRSPLYLLYVASVALRAAFRGAVGAVLVTWM